MGVNALTRAGHMVLMESGAGIGSGFSDEQYKDAGAAVLPSAEEVWSTAELILKVKEPLPDEYPYLREGLILFCYLHLAAVPELAFELKRKKVTAIAYESVRVGNSLPLLAPMSEIAGRMSVQIGANLLEKRNKGKGILLSGVPGVRRGKVTIIGGGTVGTNAAKIAVGIGADVTILDVNPERLRQLDDLFGHAVTTVMSNPYNIAEAVAASDLVIGAVLIPGAKAPRLVPEEAVRAMVPGSVIVDVAVDQGGIFETIDRVTTHEAPTYEKHGVIHYAVSNIPGIVPRTSTFALTNATLPYVLELAEKGSIRAIRENMALRSGVQTMAGHVTSEVVARDVGSEFVSLEAVLAS